MLIDVTGDPQPVTDEVFYAGRLALPSKYWRDLDNMRYYVSPKAEAGVRMVPPESALRGRRSPS